MLTTTVENIGEGILFFIFSIYTFMKQSVVVHNISFQNSFFARTLNNHVNKKLLGGGI